MHFCAKCDNMYRTKLSEDDPNKLVLYCRNCGHEDAELAMSMTVVSKTVVRKNHTNFNQFINPYTKLDPSLPHFRNIQCPNKDCVVYGGAGDAGGVGAGGGAPEQDVISIRYDHVNLKYIYLCTHCDTTWNVTNS
jgi:DNA-directed RNA polymerase subunit M/transcription elongation factor TFIIS